jgi:S-adenosylmethionine decarboxylase
MLASYFECEQSAITDADHCLTALKEAAASSGVTVVSENVHRFPNGAITAILLLAESHASIHTYPEHRSCFIDFFTCGAGDIETFDSVLKAALKPTHAEISIIERGGKKNSK